MYDDLAMTIVRSGAGLDLRDLKSLIRALRPGTSPEGSHFELKAMFAPGPGPWAELSKDIVAMANTGGGLILLGVADDGTRIGLSKSLTGMLDPAQVTDQIRRKAPGASVVTTYTELNFYSKLYGCLAIHPLRMPLLFDTEWGYNDESGKHRLAIRPGVLYVRTPGRSAPANQADLQAIWQRTVAEAAEQTLARIEQVAAVPLDSELIVTTLDSAGTGFVLAPSGEGRPVRIVDDPSIPAVPLSEILAIDAPFASVAGEAANQVRHWQQADTRHRVSKQALIRWWQQRTELSIDNATAEFGLLSAAERHGYPMFWAASMDRDHLRLVLERELSEASAVPCQVYPYVVALFFWEDRKSILDRHRPLLTPAPRSAIDKVIACSSYEEFLTSVRWATRLQHDGQLIRAADLLPDPTRARSVFADLLQAELDGDITDGQRGFTRQLDLMVHSRGVS